MEGTKQTAVTHTPRSLSFLLSSKKVPTWMTGYQIIRASHLDVALGYQNHPALKTIDSTISRMLFLAMLLFSVLFYSVSSTFLSSLLQFIGETNKTTLMPKLGHEVGFLSRECDEVGR
jgi:hypothetical protein